MPASFPASAKSFVSRNAGDVIQPAHVNDLQDEVNAIESGYLGGTAPISASNATAVHLSVSAGSTLAGLHVNGNSTFGSTITFGTVGYILPAVAPASTGLALTVSATGTPNTLVWGSPTATGTMTLLKSGSGTNTAAGATNVDTIAITGLTAVDTLMVVWEVESAAQITAVPRLYNNTDTLNLVSLTAGNNLAAGSQAMGTVYLKQRQSGATAVTMQCVGSRGLGEPAVVTETSVQNFTFTTNWTGSWTLALRHGGVTAGGTFSYSWAVFKLAGQ